MGLFEFYQDDKNKDGTWLEGEESKKDHTHNDGTYGSDIEAYRNTYKKGEGRVSREKAKDWGKIHTIKEKPESKKK